MGAWWGDALPCRTELKIPAPALLATLPRTDVSPHRGSAPTGRAAMTTQMEPCAPTVTPAQQATPASAVCAQGCRCCATVLLRPSAKTRPYEEAITNRES